MSVIIFLVILLVLVLVHEWGHFFSAKKFKIRVDEFGFGFPPKAATLFKKGDTTFTLNWLPLGGFVKIFGETPDEESTTGPDASRSFINKPRWQQAIVLFAGIFMNFLLAWVLFSVSFIAGLPASVTDSSFKDKVVDANLTVLSVLPDTPAKEAGLIPGDRIVYLAKSEVEFVEAPNITPEIVMEYVAEGEALTVSYLRGESNELGTALITPEMNTETGQVMIGIAMDTIGTLKLSFFPALWEGMKLNLEVTAGTAKGLYKIVAGALAGEKGILQNLTGPVGIVGIVGDAAEFGFAYLLSFAALISVNLAIINMIPFPALDGGRLLFLLIEKIKGSRITPHLVNTANAIGFALLILLMIVVTYHDIVKLL